MYNSLKLAAMLVAVSATAASAQGNGRNTNGVPPGHRPPAGMCRVWVTGVAPGRQSAPTDCATAEAQARVTANARVIYGSGNGVSSRTYSRKRQLSDGSWVVERVRRDANGNLTVVSSRPLTTNANGTWNHKRGDDNDQEDVNKAQRKADKQAWKNEKKADKLERKADKLENKAERKEMKGNGKKDRHEDNDEDNG